MRAAGQGRRSAAACAVITLASHDAGIAWLLLALLFAFGLGGSFWGGGGKGGGKGGRK